MTKKEFENWCKKSLRYLDGATGSNLMKAGMPSSICPEKWIIEHRHIIITLQKSYVEAGSDIILAPTFTANRLKLSEYGLADHIVDINKELVAMSKEAASDKAYVAADISMTGASLKPMGKMSFEELVSVYKEQMQILYEAGVDLYIVETMLSLQETRAALIAIKETCDLPVLCTLSFQQDGRTLYGTDAKTAAIVLASLGADAVGINCSTGPKAMINIIKDMVNSVSIPVIAKPNAGLPKVDDNGNSHYDLSCDEFVNEMQYLVDAGATILGGCCGTDPNYIKKIVDTFGHTIKMKDKREIIRALCSERKSFTFDLEDNFFVIGERINPTGKKLLKEALLNGNMDLVRNFAEEQENCGAKVIDINVGMGGIDEKLTMLQAIEEVSAVSNLPISIDSSSIEVIEAALRVYPGRALVNSVSYEKEKFERLLPIVKKYGAMFILLPLSDEGLPKTIEEKKKIIHLITERAFNLGFKKEDIVVDGLVNTVGANHHAAIDALDTIHFCKESGYATVCGLSNISFGLPERSYVNTAFLTMAIANGLTMAIANPNQELLMGCAFASNLLMNKDESDIQYIEYMQILKERQLLKEQIIQKEKQIQSEPLKKVKHSSLNQACFDDQIDEKIYLAVCKGNRSSIKAIVNDALQNGKKADYLLSNVLLKAINTVGDYYDQGKFFLPQLIAGAETMQMALEILEPLLKVDNASKHMPVIIIATVKGDIHDIGKNLVALMLRNYGFKVIDLGKDVSKEVIIDNAIKYNASIIALSALMTTTMKQMDDVIVYAKQRNCTAKIIIGGAVVTKEYADAIGADGYSKDAQDAVKLAARLLGQMNA